MRFHRGRWTHERFMDVFIEVLKVDHQNTERSKLKIRWWVRSQVPDGEPQELFRGLSASRIVVRKKDYSQWRRYEGSN